MNNMSQNQAHLIHIPLLLQVWIFKPLHVSGPKICCNVCNINYLFQCVVNTQVSYNDWACRIIGIDVSDEISIIEIIADSLDINESRKITSEQIGCQLFVKVH